MEPRPDQAVALNLDHPLAVFRADKDWAVNRCQDAKWLERFTVKKAQRNDPALHARLKREYDWLAPLEHGHLLRPLRHTGERGMAVFEDAQGTVSQLLGERGRLDVDHVANVLLQCLDALEYLHRRGLGHGAVNTETILIDPRGRVKFGDFLGYRFGEPAPPPDRPLKYQAPELINSKLGPCGPSTDLYCLGFAALEMLLPGGEFERLFLARGGAPPGKRPNWLGWHADPAMELAGWREALAHVPRCLVDILGSAIRKEVGGRAYPTARKMLEALAAFRLDSARPLSPLSTNPRRGIPAPPRHRRSPAGTGTLAAGGPRLELTQVRGRERMVNQFLPHQTILVGRQGSCDLCLDVPRASHKHALLICQAGTWCVHDLRSIAGTLVNGARVDRAPLAAGDTLEIAGARLRVTLGGWVGGPGGSGPRRLGEFELLETLREGRSGVLYKAAWAPRGGRRKFVALRVYADGFQLDADQVRRFLRGIPAAAELKHPNIVRLYKGGWCRSRPSGRTWYLAMEYLPGGSLRDRLARQGGPLGLAEVLRYALDVCEALKAAAANRLVHRNVNPACILFSATGAAKLGDFTLLRGEVLDTMQRITRAGPAAGEYVYQAPEQLRGDRDLTPSCDVYGLAATMYEALAGRPPFPVGEDLPQTLVNICETPVVTPRRHNSAIPPELEGVLLRALAKDPADRFATPSEFRRALERVGARDAGLPPDCPAPKPDRPGSDVAASREELP